MKIAVIGTHSIGKTSFIQDFKEFLALKNISCDVISEIVREISV